MPEAPAKKKQRLYQRLVGTEILYLKGGFVRRVCQESGVQFEPHDIEGAKNHLDKIGWKPGRTSGCQQQTNTKKEKAQAKTEKLAKMAEDNEERRSKNQHGECRRSISDVSTDYSGASPKSEIIIPSPLDSPAHFGKSRIDVQNELEVVHLDRESGDMVSFDLQPEESTAANEDECPSAIIPILDLTSEEATEANVGEPRCTETSKEGSLCVIVFSDGPKPKEATKQKENESQCVISPFQDSKPEECIEASQEESLFSIVSTPDSKPEEATEAKENESQCVISPFQDSKPEECTEASQQECQCEIVLTQNSKLEETTEEKEIESQNDICPLQDSKPEEATEAEESESQCVISPLQDSKPEERTQASQEESPYVIVSAQDLQPEEATGTHEEQASCVITPAQDLKPEWVTKANDLEAVPRILPTKGPKPEEASDANEEDSPCTMVSDKLKPEEPTEVVCGTGIKEHNADSVAEEAMDKCKKRETAVPALCILQPPVNERDGDVISGFASKLRPRGIQGTEVDVAHVDSGRGHSHPQVTPRRRVLAALGKRESHEVPRVDPALETFAERLARFRKK